MNDMIVIKNIVVMTVSAINVLTIQGMVIIIVLYCILLYQDWLTVYFINIHPSKAQSNIFPYMHVYWKFL